MDYGGGHSFLASWVSEYVKVRVIDHGAIHVQSSNILVSPFMLL